MKAEESHDLVGTATIPVGIEEYPVRITEKEDGRVFIEVWSKLRMAGLPDAWTYSGPKLIKGG